MDPFQNQNHLEQMLQNAVLVTELSMELKKRNEVGEKYCAYIRSAAWRAGLAINALQKCTVSYFFYAHKLILTAKGILQNIPDSDPKKHVLKNEIENLLSILEAELKDTSYSTMKPQEDFESWAKSNISERIKTLEEKQKLISSLIRTPSSTHGFKHDVDEHYPRFPSRENIINLDKVMSLPTVPEDSFTTCIKRTASSCSLSKSLRKLKYHLQHISVSEHDSAESELHAKMLYHNINDHTHDIILEDNEDDHFFKSAGNNMKDVNIHIGKNILRNNTRQSDENVEEYDRIAENDTQNPLEHNIKVYNEEIVHSANCIGQIIEDSTVQTVGNVNKCIYFRK